MRWLDAKSRKEQGMRIKTAESRSRKKKSKGKVQMAKGKMEQP
jgi:hypothetical protein